jgi:hypothetical protein
MTDKFFKINKGTKCSTQKQYQTLIIVKTLYSCVQNCEEKKTISVTTADNMIRPYEKGLGRKKPKLEPVSRFTYISYLILKYRHWYIGIPQTDTRTQNEREELRCTGRKLSEQSEITVNEKQRNYYGYFKVMLKSTLQQATEEARGRGVVEV